MDVHISTSFGRLDDTIIQSFTTFVKIPRISSPKTLFALRKLVKVVNSSKEKSLKCLKSNQKVKNGINFKSYRSNIPQVRWGTSRPQKAIYAKMTFFFIAKKPFFYSKNYHFLLLRFAKFTPNLLKF